MLKIFLWVVSKDTRFLKDAIKILERQHNGIEIVGKAIGLSAFQVSRSISIVSYNARACRFLQ